jgi:GPH family glycoside/pentoside/hexuronide:cation symporter
MCLTAGVAVNGALIDENERSTGMRKTGLFNGIFALLTTTLTSFQSIIFTNIINWFGYDGNAVVQTERAIFGIRVGAGLVPLIMGAIGFIPLLLFPISKTVEKDLSEYSSKLRRSTIKSQE